MEMMGRKRSHTTTNSNHLLHWTRARKGVRSWNLFAGSKACQMRGGEIQIGRKLIEHRGGIEIFRQFRR